MHLRAGLLAATLGMAPITAPPNGTPTLPAAFADFSLDTPAAAASPAGRAIAMYSTLAQDNDGGFRNARTLVVGADGDTYRSVEDANIDVGYTTPHPTTMLSPDGTHVLSAVRSFYMNEFVLLDLSTGASRTVYSLGGVDGGWPSDKPIPVTLYAWSPDGRWVALGYPGTRVFLLDLQTDQTANVPGGGIGATFSPDGRRVALSKGSDNASGIYDFGNLNATTLTAGPKLDADTAWSPDGTLVAMDDTTSGPCSPHTTTAIHFVAMTDGAVVPTTIPTTGCPEVLGWRTPTSILVSQLTPDGGQRTIVEYSTVDGSSSVLSRFSTGGDCRGSGSSCLVVRLQLATGLIGSVGTRPGGAQSHSAVPRWTPQQWAIVVFGALVVAALVTWLVLRRVRERRPPAPPATVDG